MIEVQTECGIFREFDGRETRENFVPLCDKIFDTSDEGLSCRSSERIFRDESWIRVLIRGGLFHSDYTLSPGRVFKREDELLAWAKDDPRDSLQPLFEILVEDGVRELVQMPTTWRIHEAITMAPTRSAIWLSFGWMDGWAIEERLMFDHTARWGFFSDYDLFGMLGGEPAFMERYIERAGGMTFIRQKADAYFQSNYNIWKTPTVPQIYKLAGWDNPPQPK